MTRSIGTLFVLVVLTVGARSALAWDGPTLWYEPAHGAVPGGGGVFGTGGARDYGITCEHCHVDRPIQPINVAVTFTPALADTGTMKLYTPGQTYQVRVDLIGEIVGTSGCGQYAKNLNGFAATFEGADGRTTGVLTSDSGQTQTSCPADYTMPAGGTTALYRDCEVIFAKEYEDITSWTFSWRAPAAGSGTVTMSHGVVDGDCSMMSMGDAVNMGQLELGEGVAAARSPADTHVVLAVWPLLALVLLGGRRRGGASIALLALVLATCGGSDAKEDGTLGGACLPGDVCSAGLVCDDGVCVSGESDRDAGVGDGGGTAAGDGGSADAAGPVGQPPEAMINHPGDGETRPAGVAIPFIGAASDPEDGPLSGSSLVWTSDLSGQFGTGESFDVPLPVGTHLITLTATDSDGNEGTDSIMITVE